MGMGCGVEKETKDWAVGWTLHSLHGMDASFCLRDGRGGRSFSPRTRFSCGAVIVLGCGLNRTVRRISKPCNPFTFTGQTEEEAHSEPRSALSSGRGADKEDSPQTYCVKYKGASLGAIVDLMGKSFTGA